MQRGLSATYPTPISIILETTDVDRFQHAYTGEKCQNFCAGVFHVPKTADFDAVDSRVFMIELQVKGTISSDGNHLGGLVNIPRM